MHRSYGLNPIPQSPKGSELVGIGMKDEISRPTFTILFITINIIPLTTNCMYMFTRLLLFKIRIRILMCLSYTSEIIYNFQARVL